MRDADRTHVYHDMVKEELGKGLAMRFRAQGGSMRPFIIAGDIVTVEPADARELRVGDVVLFQSGDLAVVHRMLYQYVRGGTAYLLTKGDSIPSPDRPVPQTRLLGRVTAIDRNGRRIDLDSAPARAFAMLLALLSPMSAYWHPAGVRVKRLLRRLGLVQ